MKNKNNKKLVLSAHQPNVFILYFKFKLGKRLEWKKLKDFTSLAKENIRWSVRILNGTCHNYSPRGAN